MKREQEEKEKKEKVAKEKKMKEKARLEAYKQFKQIAERKVTEDSLHRQAERFYTRLPYVREIGYSRARSTSPDQPRSKSSFEREMQETQQQMQESEKIQMQQEALPLNVPSQLEQAEI